MEDSNRKKTLRVGKVTEQALRDGLKNQETVQKMFETFPNAQTPERAQAA